MILAQRNSWYSKIFLIDLGKKVILKYCNEISSIDEILLKYYEFFSIVLKDGNIFIKDYNKLYEYYNIDLPDKDWLKKCKNNYIFF